MATTGLLQKPFYPRRPRSSPKKTGEPSGVFGTFVAGFSSRPKMNRVRLIMDRVRLGMDGVRLIMDGVRLGINRLLERLCTHYVSEHTVMYERKKVQQQPEPRQCLGGAGRTGCTDLDWFEGRPHRAAAQRHALQADRQEGRQHRSGCARQPRSGQEGQAELPGQVAQC